jgi:diguanylate cyclase (GGDEF)-like protein/PAS domain S-box-containing protein
MENLVELSGVRKSFGGVRALQGVDFTLRPSEVHALLGENGAGKSTLMRVLGGEHIPDAGMVMVSGERRQFRGPMDALGKGIAIIHQEMALATDLTVAENIFLAEIPSLISWRDLNRRAKELIASLGFDISPSATVSDLSVAHQQVVEIAKALSHNASVMVFDEPTAVLSTRDAERLLQIIATLRERGVGIVYISHRLDEVFRIADRITVMKDGASVATVRRTDVEINDVIRMMVGRSLKALFGEDVERTVGDEAIRVDNLSDGGRIKGASLSLRAGEIVGLGGLVGAGRTELVRMIFGAEKAHSGKIFIRGREVKMKSPRDAIPIGIALVDLEGRIIRGNATFAKLLSLPLDKVLGKHFKNFTHPDDIEADLTLFQQVLEGRRDGYTIVKRYLRPSGEIVNVLIHVAAMRDRQGKVVRFISQIEDITRHKDHERKLAERAVQLELALEPVRGGFWQMDILTGKFETSDRLAQFIAGPTAARLDLERYVNRVNVNDGAQADLTPLIAGRLDQNVAEYRLDTIHGERWMRCDRRLLHDGDGRPIKIVGMAIDFTEERRRIAILEKTARTDALTGLLNRRGLSIEFTSLQSADGFAVLALDLDGLKAVNDAHGHAMGDFVPQTTAARLTSAVRDRDLVARTGGDEFVVVVAGDRTAGEAAAERILERMREPRAIDDGTVDVRVSIGASGRAKSVM